MSFFLGNVLWTLHFHMPLVNFSLPRRLPDLNGDGVTELVAAAAVTLPSGVNDNRIHVRNNLVLVSGADGLDAIREIFSEASAFLKDGGLLALETGIGQQTELDCLSATAQLKGESLNDLSDRPRFYFARKASGK